MKIKVLLFTFIFIIISACNVAEKTAIKSAQDNTTQTPDESKTAIEKQKIYFLHSGVTRLESDSTYEIYIKRKGTNIPSNQKVILENLGTAQLSDLRAVNPITYNNGTPVTLISSSPLQFEFEFKNGDVTAQFTLHTNDDNIHESDERFVFQIKENINKEYNIGSLSSFIYQITNNDQLPTAQFLTSVKTGAEGSLQTSTISLSNPSESQISIQIQSSGNASSSDHSFVDQIITFPPGITSQNLNITLNDDVYSERNEVLSLEMTTIENAMAGVIKKQSITITDTDVSPSIQFNSATASLNENGTLIVSATLTGIIEQDIIVPVRVLATSTATEHKDYNFQKRYFKFLKNNGASQVANMSISAIDDIIFESAEVINLQMDQHEFANIGTQSTTVITINNNEPLPKVGFANTSYLTQEGSTFYVPITTDFAFGASIDVNYTISTAANRATSGIDFTLPATGSFTIPAGSKLVQIPVPIIADSAFDNNELLDITLTGFTLPAGYTASLSTSTNLIATIRESGAMPIIQFVNAQKSVTEGSLLETHLNLSKPSAYDLDIDLGFEHKSTLSNDFGSYTAISGCTVAGEKITILAGQTLCRIHLGTVADNLDEHQEQFIVKMKQPNQMAIGAISSKNVTIIDNDAPSVVSVSSTLATISEGNSTSLNFTLDRISGKDIKVYYTLSGTAEANGIDHSLTTLKNPSTGADTFKNSITIRSGTLSSSAIINAISDNDFDSSPTETMTLTIDTAPIADQSYTIGTAATTVNITDNDTIPTLSITSLPTGGSVRILSVNEGDIVSIPVELSSTTNQDITFTYAVDSNFSAATCGSKCASFAAGTEDTTLPETGSFTIPKGSKKAIISFQVKDDAVFESALNERFRITIAESVPASAAYDINTVNTANIIDVNIKDINSAPTARFLDAQREKVEGSGNLHIPVILSNASDSDVILLVNVKQTNDAAFKKPDLNDIRIKTRAAGATATTDPISDLDSSTTNPPDSAQTPGWHRPLTYNNFASVMAQTVLRIPAGQKKAYVTIEPITDDLAGGIKLFEGTEQAILDLVVPIGTGYKVDSNFETLKFNILDSDASPVVKFTTVPAPVQAEGNPTNQAAVFTQSAGGISYGLSRYDVVVSPLPQNIDVSFDVNFSGTMSFASTIASPNDFMEFDYSLSLATMNSNISGTITPNKVAFILSGGSPTDTVSYLTAINRDYKYEQNETLIASITNIQNAAASNLMTSTTTYTNDDAAPFLRITPLTPLVSTIPETDNEHTLTFELESNDGNFKGKYITQVETTLPYTVARTDRISAGVTNHTGTIPLLVGGNYSNTLKIDPSLVGDFRKYSRLVFSPTFTSAAIARPATTYSRTWNLTVEDLKIGVSKYSPIDTTSGLKLKGHTCTIYRGLVNCFGGNDSGQLGRGNKFDWGGNGQIIEQKSNTLDLGLDKFNHPRYVKSIALGERHTCALFNDNNVRCWGDNSFGQLGVGNTNDVGDDAGEMGNSLVPINFGTTPKTILSIHAMRNTTCVLTEVTASPATKEIYCWGDNSQYQIGIEDITDTRIGDHISDLGDAYLKAIVPNNIKLFETGGNHACLITTTNVMHCWGDNTHGQLGLNVTTNPFGTNVNGITSRSVAISNISLINEISMGVNHTCVRSTSGTYNTRCWGDNSYGQLGLGRVTKMGGINSNQYTYASTTGLNRIDNIGRANATRAQLLINNGNHGSNPYAGHSTNNDQLSQVYYPSSSIATGMGYTCGVYSSRMDLLNPGNIVTPPLQSYTNRAGERYIRCWGSNSITENTNYVEATLKADIGVLSNIGANYAFNASWQGIPLIPFVKTNTDQVPISLGASCLNASGVETGNTACSFINRLRDIGDSSNSATANGYINNAFTQILTDVGSVETVNALDTYTSGWTSNFLGSGATVNFELNYYYSMHRKDLRAYTDIKLYGGAHHICAAIRSSGSSHSNNLLCWGANHAGQAGVDLTVNDPLPAGVNFTEIVGGSRSKGLGEGTVKNFSYSF